MSSKFTEKAEEALSMAHDLAEELGHTYIGTEHLLLGLSSRQSSFSGAALGRFGLGKERLTEIITGIVGKGAKTSLTSLDMTPRLEDVIESAYSVALKYSARRIGTEHLLCALLEKRESSAVRILLSVNTDLEGLSDEITTALRAGVRSERTGVKEKPKHPTLAKYGKNMTEASKKYDPLIGRDKEVERVIRILLRKNKNNPCLVGEAGVGKTAIVEGLAARIMQKSVPEALIGKTVYSVDLCSLVAGAKYRGDFEERIVALCDEAAKDPDIILFIDEIHTVVGAGAAEGAIDAANILKPKLARGEIRLIGATTFEEYRRYIEKDSALERRFQKVSVEEPGVDDTLTILRGIKSRYEKHHGVIIDDGALVAAAELSERYITDRHMPDKAIDLVDEACAICSLKSTSYSEKSAELIEKIRQIDEQKEEALLSLDLEGAAVLKDMELGYRQRLDALIKQEKENRTKPTLISDDIYDLITQIVGTDINVLGNERFSGLKERLSRAVIGQEEAVDALCDGVMSASIKMGRKERPLGVFLFVGESGVGKTALAEALAKEVLGSEKFLLRFDMSEFSERSSTAGFIGSAPGYVGYDDGAGVLNRVRRQPYSVVLFDEIEKASPEVRNLLLQITDYGKIRDSHGREVSFKNTYVIMTSNLGGAPSVGIGFEGNKGGTSSAERALRSVFSEELLGRMDRVVYFKHPEIADLISIARKRFDEIGLRLSEYNASLEYGDEVLSFVARKGLSLGSVRNILSVIKRDVESKIALLLSEKRDFGGVIRVGVSENRITVEETKPYAIP